MNRLFSIAIILLCAISCSVIDSHKTLRDVESYIMEHPDSALSVLESMNREDLVINKNKAHHALLHAMALDKNYIDVTDDSIAMVAVDYYQKRGTKSKRARALYYLGKSYYYNQEYDKAILEFSKAEKIAQDCDSLYLGMIKTAKAGVYNKTYNSIEELKYTKEALEIFNAIGQETYSRSMTYSLGVAYYNVDQYEKALDVYNYILNSSSKVDYFYIKSVVSCAHSMIELDDVDYNVVDSLFRSAKYVYNAELSDEDYWAWAYTLYRIGNRNEAEQMLNAIESSDELLENFWKLRIDAYLGNNISIYDRAKFSIKHQSRVVEKLLEESLASYQRDYYQSQLDLAEQLVKVKNLGLTAGVLLFIMFFIITFATINRYIVKQRLEKEKLFEYIEEIKSQLSRAQSNDYSELKRRYLDLYKTKFETIGILSDQYIQAAGRTDIDSIILKKVEVLISEVRNDMSNRIAFEAMLDKDLDMIMTRLRSEMPKLKEIDYAIFSYCVVGFDSTTISRLLDMTINNVYARKHRIKVKIAEKSPEHISQFLEMLV